MPQLLYRCLLRLHPPAFRRRFGDEMLSIYDQAHGTRPAVLLLLDATISLFRQWALRPEFWSEIPERAQPALDGIPSFCTLAPFRPRATAVVPGLVLSLIVFSLTGVAIKYSWIHVLHVRIPEVQFEESPWIPQSASHNDARQDSPDADRQAEQPEPSPGTQSRAESTPISNPQPAAAAPLPKTQEIATPSFEKNRPQPVTQPLIASRASAAGQVETEISGEDTPFDSAARHRVIQGAVENLNKYYVDTSVARQISETMRAHEANGDDNAAANGDVFADLLTGQIRNASHDPRIVVLYNPADGPEARQAPTAEEVARYKNAMVRLNCTFERVAILRHNIGYLKLNAFPDASICGPTARAAMAKLNHADAIIFDLRDNPGGYANMVALLATYLFDRPTHLNDFYDRAQNATEESWTLAPLSDSRLANKPVYVLTSRTTFSAAEAFSYDLKMLKRATLVGETTSGRAHLGAEYRIDDHFTIRIPSVKVTNPISGTNWEGTGVEPNVKVKASDALKIAIHLAEAKVRK